MPDDITQLTEPSPVLEKALRLFRFLEKVQDQRTKPLRLYEAYKKHGGVLLLGGITDHKAIFLPPVDPNPEEPILWVDRVARIDPPDVPLEIEDWVLLDTVQDLNGSPTLRDSIIQQTDSDSGEIITIYQSIDDNPEVLESFESWRPKWERWAETEIENQKVRDLYANLFRMSEQAVATPETLQLVLGIGCLSWNPPEGHDPVSRHLITVGAHIKFDDKTGRLTVEAESDADALKVELDMMDPTLWPNRERLQEIQDEVEKNTTHPLHREKVGELLRRLAHVLSADGKYLDVDEPSTPGPTATVSFHPALILRRRSDSALLQLFQKIQEQLEESGEVPFGIRLLIGALDEATGDGDGDGQVPGEFDGEDTEYYLPLPANEEQLRIIERVESRSHTVVQGPPGTGKTHTIANLLAHLLARGKRVLITAHTDRALRELKDKLPKELSELCVAVIGQGRSDLAALKVSAETLASKAAEHNESESTEKIQTLKDRLDQLERDKSKHYKRLLEVREAEIRDHEHGRYKGSLARIAEEVAAEEDKIGWLKEYGPNLDTGAPLTNRDYLRWLALLRDIELAQHEVESNRKLPQEDVPTPEQFDQWVTLEETTTAAAAGYGDLRTHSAYAAIAALEPPVQEALCARMEKLVETVEKLASRDEAWMLAALKSVRSGRRGEWQLRYDKIRQHLDETQPLVEKAGSTSTITLDGPDGNTLRPQAKALLGHLKAGKKLRIFGVASGPLRNAKELLERVRVDGAKPLTVNALEAFLVWLKLGDTEKLWPADVDIPTEDTLIEQWGWNDDECNQLSQVIELGTAFPEEEERLENLGIMTPDWTDLKAVLTLGQVAVAASKGEEAVAARAPLAALEESVQVLCRHQDAAKVTQDFLQSVSARDRQAYRVTLEGVELLRRVGRKAAERDELEEALGESTSGLVSSVRGDLSDVQWDARLAKMEEAWEWCRVDMWLEKMVVSDVGKLQEELKAIEAEILDVTAKLTAAQAWSLAVNRLGPREQSNLKAYALAVRKIGKGKGKYAPHQKIEAQRALQECRTAVPAWIMPLYRIASTVDVGQGIFDVVIIDEASQAGLEATFLQYLADKIVVVGDDKQVSPSAVGLDRQELISLRQQLLHDFDHGSIWEDPRISFFDQSRVRTPDVITLREHFRCVPEIIGFSNLVAYEPDNVPLIPLRQFGKDRLRIPMK